MTVNSVLRAGGFAASIFIEGCIAGVYLTGDATFMILGLFFGFFGIVLPLTLLILLVTGILGLLMPGFKSVQIGKNGKVFFWLLMLVCGVLGISVGMAAPDTVTHYWLFVERFWGALI